MWLGHHSPAFTLERYVHVLPEDVPTPDGFDDLIVGNEWATESVESDRNVVVSIDPISALEQEVRSVALGASGL